MNDYGLASAQTQHDRQEPVYHDDWKYRCDRCNKPIYEGEELFDIEGEYLCSECVFELYGRYA